MASIDDFNTSNYLKKEDVDPAIVATIAETRLEDFNGSRKLVVAFKEDMKDLVAGAKVNREAIADVAGTKDYTQWKGVRIELYRDNNVYDLNGRRVGGIRIRPPAQRVRAAAITQPDPPPAEEELEDWEV